VIHRLQLCCFFVLLDSKISMPNPFRGVSHKKVSSTVLELPVRLTSSSP